MSHGGTPERPHRVEALLVIALAALDDGQTSRAAASYGEAMAEMHRYGLYAPLTEVPALHREHLVEACRRSGVDVDETHGVPPAIVPAPRTVERLSRAEHRVLVAVARHGSASATASALHLSENTVWFHLKRIYRKLGAAGRDEAIRIAHDLGLLAEEESESW